MDLWDCATGFMNSQALFAADQIGVFDRLEAAPATEAEVAASLGTPADTTTRLLTMLVSLGLIERRSDGLLQNSAAASRELVRSSPGYVGGMLRHLREDLYPLWQFCREAVEERQPQWRRAFPESEAPTEGMYENPEALRAFMEGMHAITYTAGRVFAERAPELQELSSMVDVGGATGAFTIASAEAAPQLAGTVFDLPQVQPVAEEHFRRHGVEERVQFQPGNFWHDELPPGADAYVLGFILHDWKDEGGDIVLEKVSRAADRSARLIVGEFLLDDDRAGPLFVARQDLNMLLAAQGRERTAGEYAAWIGRHGFELERIEGAPYGKHFMIARRR